MFNIRYLPRWLKNKTATPNCVSKEGHCCGRAGLSKFRFSEDLDFDWVGFHKPVDKDSILIFLQDVMKLTRRRYGTECDVRWGSQNAVVSWRNADLGSGNIKIDVNHKMKPENLPETSEWEIIGRYPEIRQPYPVYGYSANSVATAKLDCILSPSRAKARDYYDMNRLIASGDIDPAVFVGQHIRQHGLSFEGSPGAALMEAMYEESLQAIERLRVDYAKSLNGKIISDGPETFDELFDEWHDRVAECLDEFDLMVEQERHGEQSLSMPSAINQVSGLPSVANALERARCGKLLPILKTRCTRPKGHRGACRRDKQGI